MENLLQDLKYAFRMLTKKIGFTAVAVIALALGIGANTAIFSVVNTVLLKPLPFKDPDQLVTVSHHYPRLTLMAPVSAPGFTDYRNQCQSFENSAVSTGWNVNLTGQGEPERIQGRLATPGFFQTLGVEAALGRTFLDEEDQPGRNRVVVLSDGLWKRRFGSDPKILNQTLTLNGENYTVIGVMPDYFRLYGSDEMWAPLGFTPDQLTPNRRTNEFLLMIARMKPGVRIEQAQAEMTSIGKGLQEQYPNNYPQGDDWGLALKLLKEDFIGDIRPLLVMLLVAVGFVLLIACANVANLQLARAMARRKEIAIRTALGAGRMRLIRQLLTESVLLSLVGGALGLGLAVLGVKALVALNENAIPRSREIGVDAGVLTFTILISLITGVVFGLVPALQASKLGLSETLKEGGRSSSSRSRFRSILVVAEVALALVPLIGAGLVIKSFIRVLDVDPGFKPENLLSMQLSLPASKYREPAQVRTFFQQALERIGAVPGVKAVGGVTGLPMSGAVSSGSFSIEGRQVGPGEMNPHSDRRIATTNYFQTMNIPLMAGRYFTEQDHADAPGVAIVDETLAKKYWPDENAVGKRLSFEGGQSNPRWREVVGIVGHVKQYGLDTQSRVQMYVPHAQLPASNISLVMRAERDPSGLTSAVREAIQSVDPDQPIYRVMTMESMLANSTAQRRFSMFLLGIFAVVALVLAAVGLYGVMAYSVTQRTHEIGIRMALGAKRGDVLRLVIGQGMGLATIGMFIGLGVSLLLAFLLTRFMTSLLFGVSTTDPMTFVVISLVLGGTAVLASYIPARRATKVDPMVALRYE